MNIAVLALIVLVGVIVMVQGSVAIAADKARIGCSKDDPQAVSLYNTQVAFLVIGILAIVSAIGVGAYIVYEGPAKAPRGTGITSANTAPAAPVA